MKKICKDCNKAFESKELNLNLVCKRCSIKNIDLKNQQKITLLNLT